MPPRPRHSKMGRLTQRRDPLNACGWLSGAPSEPGSARAAAPASAQRTLGVAGTVACRVGDGEGASAFLGVGVRAAGLGALWRPASASGASAEEEGSARLGVPPPHGGAGG